MSEDLTLTIEELDALAEVLIPAMELKDIRREPEEYLAQTASDLYDRVVYMVRANKMEEGPEPRLSIQLQRGIWSAHRETWLETRRQRQDWLKKSIVEMYITMPKIDE